MNTSLNTDGAETVVLEPARLHDVRYIGGTEFVLLLLHDVAYCLTVAVLLFVFLVRIVTVDGDSMHPTLLHRDVLILLSSHWYQSPESGDIVVAKIPELSNEPIVKRVAAVEGDTVDLDPETGAVLVNGQRLNSGTGTTTPVLGSGLERTEFPLTVQPNHVFLLGDNSAVSLDSRYEVIGQVDNRCILGKVIFLAWPGADNGAQAGTISRFGVVR